MSQKTFIFLKPDAVRRGLIGRILSRFEERGLSIVEAKMMVISKELSDRHYSEHVTKGFYPELRDYVTSGPVLAAVLEGPNVVELVRTMVGATDPVKANPGTIRADFGLHLGENVIHASDSLESAAKEISNFFG